MAITDDKPVRGKAAGEFSMAVHYSCGVGAAGRFVRPKKWSATNLRTHWHADALTPEGSEPLAGGWAQRYHR